jgi:hypothetical protein
MSPNFGTKEKALQNQSSSPHKSQNPIEKSQTPTPQQQKSHFQNPDFSNDLNEK